MEMYQFWVIICTLGTMVLAGIGAVAWIVKRIDRVKEELQDFRKELSVESKDFHGRLCFMEGKKAKT